MTTEVGIMRRIQTALTVLGARVFRNNVGLLEDRCGNKVRYGLCVGSSDLIGWNSLLVTPDLVGKRVAIFLAVEVKKPWGKVTDEQEAFIAAVRRAGGIAIVAHSPDEAVTKLKETQPMKPSDYPAAMPA